MDPWHVTHFFSSSPRVTTGNTRPTDWPASRLPNLSYLLPIATTFRLIITAIRLIGHRSQPPTIGDSQEDRVIQRKQILFHPSTCSLFRYPKTRIPLSARGIVVVEGVRGVCLSMMIDWSATQHRHSGWQVEREGIIGRRLEGEKKGRLGEGVV